MGLSSKIARDANRVALAGFVLFAVFAPHSISGAEIALAIAAGGWLFRTIAARGTGIRRTALDLPIWLFFGWTVASAFLSEEPTISIPKIPTAGLFVLFYLTQAVVTRRAAIVLAGVMIASGVAGTLWSAVDLARGRGVIVESIAAWSPLREVPVEARDAVWRVGGRRVRSVAEIDELIRRAPAGTLLSVSMIAHGENAEKDGFMVTDEMRARASPSGITGSQPTHRFRASGWTGHYYTFAEILQIVAQLALALALASLARRPRYPAPSRSEGSLPLRSRFGSGRYRSRHGTKGRWRPGLCFVAYALLAFGIALTAMRTALVALAIGSAMIAWRVLRRHQVAIIGVVISAILVAGSALVWRTRATGALRLADPSSSLRLSMARVALSRVMRHPLFGHGMDAVHKHWNEWGFPGTEMVHTHSTPLQLAFDRGLPALLFWLWIIGAFWVIATRAEKRARAIHEFTRNGRKEIPVKSSQEVNAHGVLLGATGALAGFFASSLVNYNFGTAEVALVFWWLMGVVVALAH